MSQRGPSKTTFSVTNMCPIRISLRLQASSYARKLSGKASLNIKATLEEKQFVTTQISDEYLLQYHNQQVGYDYIIPGIVMKIAADPQKNLGLS